MSPQSTNESATITQKEDISKKPKAKRPFSWNNLSGWIQGKFNKFAHGPEREKTILRIKIPSNECTFIPTYPSLTIIKENATTLLPQFNLNRIEGLRGGWDLYRATFNHGGK